MTRHLLALLLIMVALPASASTVHHQTLEEVLVSLDMLIIEVEITDAEKAFRSGSVVYTYDIDVHDVMNGALEHTPAQAVHTVRIPVRRDPRTGARIRYSPILPSSGIETGLQIGERYWMLARHTPSDPDAVLLITRAEPLENADQIRAILDVLKE